MLLIEIKNEFHHFINFFILESDFVCGAFREIRNVELLKLRFGESHMHYCEVMLKVMSQNFRHIFKIHYRFRAALHEVFVR